jgi:hypothetical protein
MKYHYKITYLSKAHKFQPKDEFFKTWDEAATWGKKNLPNFNPDMIQIN